LLLFAIDYFTLGLSPPLQHQSFIQKHEAGIDHTLITTVFFVDVDLGKLATVFGIVFLSKLFLIKIVEFVFHLVSVLDCK
jgi:hypothetical protein